MRKYLIILIWLSVVSCAYGVHFTYYDGHVRASALAYAEAGEDANGPAVHVTNSDEDCTAKKLLFAVDMGGRRAVSGAYQAIGSFIDANDGDDIAFVSGPTSILRANDSSSYGDANAIGSTQDPNTYGIFYRIDPDGDQQNGEPVRVRYEWRIRVIYHIGGSTYAYAGGPRDGNDGAYEDMSYMAITRGILPPVTGDFAPLDPSKVPWHHINVEIENDSCNYSSDTLPTRPSFMAQIGDVIGIFAENQTLIEANGPTDEAIQGGVTIALSLSYLEGDLDFDGDIDWVDFAIFAENWLAGVEEP